MGGDISYTLIIQVNKLGSGQGLIERPVQKPIELALKKVAMGQQSAYTLMTGRLGRFRPIKFRPIKFRPIKSASASELACR